MAIGLYTVAFESLVLTIKNQIQGHLKRQDPATLRKFYKSLGTANTTLNFCQPILVTAGVIDSGDVDSLIAIRRRRNEMAHEGYNKAFDLTIDAVAEDIRAMFKLAKKVENWRQSTDGTSSTGSSEFTIAPSIFFLYLEAAQLLARTTLAVPPEISEV